jgi:IS30 family transposase
VSTGTGTAKEYTFGEIAAELGVSHSTVRNLFHREPDVHRVDVPESRRPAYRAAKRLRTSQAPDLKPTPDSAPLTRSVCNRCVTDHANNAIFAIHATDKSITFALSMCCAGSSPARKSRRQSSGQDYKKRAATDKRWCWI